MKKISKEFWVRDNCLSMLKCDHEYLVRAGIFSVSTHKNEEYIKKITISWEESIAKIELDEDRFERCHRMIMGESNYDKGVRSTHLEILKQKLFGKTE